MLVAQYMDNAIQSIQTGTWYYFTVDLDHEGYAPFSFEKFIQTNDRVAALVNFPDKLFFSSRKILLLPYSNEANYFQCSDSETLSVWAFDGTGLENLDFVDLASNWPHNILDKAAITPSQDTATKWTC